jgi:hypothetical protein
MISVMKNRAGEFDATAYGRRAAAGMDVARVVDRTLEMLFAAAQDPHIRDSLLVLRSDVQQQKEALIDKMADIYASVYTAEELKALVEFLEGPAGQAMRAKQSEVESRVQRATTEFLQDLVARHEPQQ